VRPEMLLLEAAWAREGAVEARERGDYATRSAVLEAAVPAMSNVAECDNVLRKEFEDLRAMAAQFESQDLTAADAKYLAQRAYNANRKRERYTDRLSRRRNHE